MTPEQTSKIIDILEAEYPNSFSKLDDRGRALKLELWARKFASDDFRIVYAAVCVLLETPRQFAPNIGEVREEILKLTEREELTEQDAWSLVYAACANGIYGYNEEYKKLPEAVQMAVGSPSQLKEWAMVDTVTLQSVIASNFRRSYRTIQERIKRDAIMPPEIKRLVSALAGTMIGAADRRQLNSAEKKALLASVESAEAITEKEEETAMPPLSFKMEEAKPYDPLSETEFEEKRAEALRMLEGVG